MYALVDLSPHASVAVKSFSMQESLRAFVQEIGEVWTFHTRESFKNTRIYSNFQMRKQRARRNEDSRLLRNQVYI